MSLSHVRADEPVQRELQTIARLHQREPHVVGAGRTVEVAGRDEHAGAMGEAGRDLPAVVGAVLGAQPQVEQRVTAVVHQAVRRERGPHQVSPLGVAGALRVDVRRRRRARPRPRPVPPSAP